MGKRVSGQEATEVGRRRERKMNWKSSDRTKDEWAKLKVKKEIEELVHEVRELRGWRMHAQGGEEQELRDTTKGQKMIA